MTTDERTLLQSVLTDAEYAMKHLSGLVIHYASGRRAKDALERIKANLEKLLNDEDE